MTRGTRILTLVGKGIAVGIFTIIAVALCFEFYLRQAGFLKAQPANYPCVTGDPVLNHLFQPNCEGVATAAALKTAKDVTYKTNALGFRGHLPEPGKPALVVIGDSYTEGFGLAENETFPFVLEQELRKGGAKDWQVLNGGTLGFTTALYPIYFDRFFRSIGPKFVLLNLDFTDFTDDSYFLEIADYDALNQPVAFPGRDAMPSWALPYVYSNRSALIRFLHQEINQWSAVKRREAAKERMDRWIAALERLVPVADLKPAGLEGCSNSIEAVAKHILLLRERAKASGAKFAIHMYPPGYLLKSYAGQPQNISFVQKWDQRTRTDFSWACGATPKMADVMRSFAARQGIPFFDSFPLILGRPDKADLYFEQDAHWNEKGVKVVVANLAKSLLPLLKARGGAEK